MLQPRLALLLSLLACGRTGLGALPPDDDVPLPRPPVLPAPSPGPTPTPAPTPAPVCAAAGAPLQELSLPGFFSHLALASAPDAVWLATTEFRLEGKVILYRLADGCAQRVAELAARWPQQPDVAVQGDTVFVSFRETNVGVAIGRWHDGQFTRDGALPSPDFGAPANHWHVTFSTPRLVLRPEGGAWLVVPDPVDSFPPSIFGAYLLERGPSGWRQREVLAKGPAVTVHAKGSRFALARGSSVVEYTLDALGTPSVSRSMLCANVCSDIRLLDASPVDAVLEVDELNVGPVVRALNFGSFGHSPQLLPGVPLGGRLGLGGLDAVARPGGDITIVYDSCAQLPPPDLGCVPKTGRYTLARSTDGSAWSELLTVEGNWALLAVDPRGAVVLATVKSQTLEEEPEGLIRVRWLADPAR